MTIDVAESKKLHNNSGNRLWQYAIQTDMYNYGLTFQPIGREDKSPGGYKEIMCHLIFDVVMKLIQKA